MYLGNNNVKKSIVQIEHEHNTTKKSKNINNFLVKDTIVSDTIVPLCESTIEKTVNNSDDKTTEGKISFSVIVIFQ